LPHQVVDLVLVDFDRDAAPSVDSAPAHAARPKAKSNRRLPRGLRLPPRALVRLYRHDRGDEWRRRSRPQFRPNAAPNEVWPTVHYRIPIGGSRAPRRARTLVSGSMPAGTR
jgi:hypothetical protein